MTTEQKQRDIKRLPLILDLMRFRLRLHAVDAFIWLFIMGLPAVPGLIVREFFNTLTGDAVLGWNAYAVLGLWVGLVGVNVAVIFAGRHTKTQHRFAISALVRRNMLDALMNRPGAEPLQNRNGRSTTAGEVVSYLRDDGEQIEDQLQFLPELTGIGVFAVISFVILLTVNWQVTVFVFIPLLVIVGVVQWAWNRIQKLRQDGRQATQKVTGFIGEMFSTVQAIQIAGATESVLRHFRDANDRRRQTMVRDELFTAVLASVFRNIVTIGTGIMLLLLALRTDLTLTVGDFALFVYFLGFIGEFLAFFGLFMAFIRQTDVAFDRLTALAPDRQPRFLTESKPMHFNTLLWKRVDLPPVEQPIDNPEKRLNVLAVSDLTYCYPDSRRGVVDVSFTLRRGELLVITGAIGSGKTTLLRTLQGLLTPQSGTITWNGQVVENPKAFFVPPRSAYVPQVPILFSDTLRNNILLGLDQSDDAVHEVIRTAVFDQDVGVFPDGLDTLVGSKGTRLSGGQVQRTAAARMLVRRPDLLIFDDLSSALDVVTEQQLWKRIFENADDWQPACLVVSHRRTLLRRADHILILKEGRVDAEGRLEDLLESNDEIQHIWQTGEQE